MYQLKTINIIIKRSNVLNQSQSIFFIEVINTYTIKKVINISDNEVKNMEL